MKPPVIERNFRPEPTGLSKWVKAICGAGVFVMIFFLLQHAAFN